MSKIILLNITADVPEEFFTLPPSVRPAWRQLWWVEDNDIVISPVPVDPKFFSYVGDVLGFDPRSVTVVVNREACADDRALCDSTFIEQIRSLTATSSHWKLIASKSTPGLTRFMRTLEMEGYPDTALAREGANQLLNRKSAFRRIASGLGSPLPLGEVVESPTELGDALVRLQGHTGEVIVKRDNAGGGYGNIIVGDKRGPRPGAYMTQQTDGPLPFKRVEKIWARLTSRLEQSVVVEVYHEASHMFYYEFFLNTYGAIEFLNSGDIQTGIYPGAASHHWKGLQLPANLPPGTMGRSLTHATQLAHRVADLGYCGYLNIDFIQTLSGEIFVNEINSRWGGGTILHVICKRLGGPSYNDSIIVRLVRDVEFIPLADVLFAFENAKLDPYGETNTGILVLSCDPVRQTGMDLVIRGDTPEHVDELEKHARRVIEECKSLKDSFESARA